MTRLATPAAGSDGRYRGTLFDRLGPDAGLFLKSMWWAGALAFVAGFFGALGAIVTGGGISKIVLWSLAAGLVGGAGSAISVGWLSHAIGTGFLSFLQPNGSTEPQFSFQDAMVARGDVAAAIASYERLLQSTPRSAAVCVRAADLYTLTGASENCQLAVQLYKRVQRLPAVSAQDYVYATNRLIDLYLGKLADRDNGMRELRRLADCYPESAVGQSARRAYIRMKEDCRSSEAEAPRSDLRDEVGFRKLQRPG